MTHEEIEAAIERLRKISYGARKYNALEAVEAVIPDGSWVDGLIDLLKQADPDTHVKLPVDADSVPIHVGDELCGYGHPKGGVYCQAIINGWGVAVATAPIPTDTSGWWLWNVSDIHHYHKPTVEDVLREFVNRVMSYNEDEDDEDVMIWECAAKLREVIADE